MPTYVCSVPANLLSAEQKMSVAQAISRAHSEATGAPEYFVQVVIEEGKFADRFLGGQLATDHIWIRGDIRAGRSEEQRRTLMLQIAKAVAQIVGISEELIWIYLCNLAPTDMMEYGHVLPAPGEEQAWFERLPQSLRDYLTDLDSDEKRFAL